MLLPILATMVVEHRYFTPLRMGRSGLESSTPLAVWAPVSNFRLLFSSAFRTTPWQRAAAIRSLLALDSLGVTPSDLAAQHNVSTHTETTHPVRGACLSKFHRPFKQRDAKTKAMRTHFPFSLPWNWRTPRRGHLSTRPNHPRHLNRA